MNRKVWDVNWIPSHGAVKEEKVASRKQIWWGIQSHIAAWFRVSVSMILLSSTFWWERENVWKKRWWIFLSCSFPTIALWTTECLSGYLISEVRLRKFSQLLMRMPHLTLNSRDDKQSIEIECEKLGRGEGKHEDDRRWLCHCAPLVTHSPLSPVAQQFVRTRATRLTLNITWFPKLRSQVSSSLPNQSLLSSVRCSDRKIFLHQACVRWQNRKSLLGWVTFGSCEWNIHVP